MLLIFRIPKMEFKLKTKSNLLNKQVSHLKNLSILNPFEIFCWVKRNKAYTQLLYIFLLSQKNKVYTQLFYIFAESKGTKRTLSCCIFFAESKEQSVHSVVVYFCWVKRNKAYTQLLYIFAESKGTKRTLSRCIFFSRLSFKKTLCVHIWNSISEFKKCTLKLIKA